MPHNNNIFVTFYGNGYRITVQRGSGLGRGLAPPQKKYNAIQVKLFTSRKDTVRNLVYSCAHAPPSKISTAVKTTCERIAPSKSFLGAVYNHGRLYSGHDWLLWVRSLSVHDSFGTKGWTVSVHDEFGTYEINFGTCVFL